MPAVPHLHRTWPLANCFWQPCLPEIQTQVYSRCLGRDAWKAAFFSVVHVPLTGEADACPGAKLMGLSLLLLYKGPEDSPMDSCAYRLNIE